MHLEQKVNIHNRFDIHIDNIETGEHREVAAYNIVLNQMWDRLCAGAGYFNNIQYGIGIGTPVATRTSLFVPLGSKPAVDVELIKATPVSRWKRKIVLNPEEHVGSIITEVGIGYSTGSTLITHAMLKDAEGNPISIIKTATDVVTIYATVFITFNQDILVGLPNSNTLLNYLIGGSTLNIGSFILSAFLGSRLPLGSVASGWTADIPNKKRKSTVARFDINTGNGSASILGVDNLFKRSLMDIPGFTGHPLLGVPVGTGDGLTKNWILPSANIDVTTLGIKVAGVAVANYLKKNIIADFSRMSDAPYPPTDRGRGVTLTPDGLVMAVAHDGSPFVTTYDWIADAWVKRPNPAPLPPASCYGVSLTPDGLVMAVAHDGSPFVTTYDWVAGAWVKRPNPTYLPSSYGFGVALTPDGLVMGVAYGTTPYVTTYDWAAGAWVKRPNPASLPPAVCYGVTLTPDGLIMAVSHGTTPYVTTYDWAAGAWVKRANPTSLPSSNGFGVSLTPDGLVMAVAQDGSPFVTTYDWVAGAWVKRPNPASLPPATGYGVALTPDGLVLIVAHIGSPFVTTYDWAEGAWVKRPNPTSLPSSHGFGAAVTPDGLVMAVAHMLNPYVSTYKAQPMTQIIFDVSPTNAAAITADYTVKGIHKTNQFVVDVSCAIQFGEGV